MKKIDKLEESKNSSLKHLRFAKSFIELRTIGGQRKSFIERGLEQTLDRTTKTKSVVVDDNEANFTKLES